MTVIYLDIYNYDMCCYEQLSSATVWPSLCLYLTAANIKITCLFLWCIHWGNRSFVLVAIVLLILATVQYNYYYNLRRMFSISPASHSVPFRWHAQLPSGYLHTPPTYMIVIQLVECWISIHFTSYISNREVPLFRGSKYYSRVPSIWKSLSAISLKMLTSTVTWVGLVWVQLPASAGSGYSSSAGHQQLTSITPKVEKSGFFSSLLTPTPSRCSKTWGVSNWLEAFCLPAET